MRTFEKRTKADTQGRLQIDPVACEGIGMCAHLAPALLHLDPWGYPVIPVGTVAGSDARAAVRAVRGCPRRALRFNDVRPAAP